MARVAHITEDEAVETARALIRSQPERERHLLPPLARGWVDLMCTEFGLQYRPDAPALFCRQL